jgi:CBS domain containing-hemolysin-like protein
MIEILLGIGLVCLIGVGSVWHAVATLAREVSSLQVTHATRVQRARILGSALALSGRVGVVMLGVAVTARATNEVTLAAWSAAGALLLAHSVQWVAHTCARRNLERLAVPLLGEAVVFLPLVEARAKSLPRTREQAVEQMVDASARAGLIESDERAMITGILQLDRTFAREIMVPRIDMVAVEVETPLAQALDVMIAGAHSRVPVYEESIDHIVGVLYAKDLLRVWRDGPADVPLRMLLRPAYFVPESKRLDELLQELQRHHVHMAIVVDEFGGTAGIVTIEDVLEEIVGEIQDEYDIGEEPLVEQVSENEGVFNARATIDDVNQALALDLPDESDTLAGLVYQHLEKLPKVGDQVQVGNAHITVLEMLGRRIKKVRVSKVDRSVVSVQ